MKKGTSNFEFRQQASLSQRVGFKLPIVQKLAGSDPEISESIGIITYLGEKGIIDKASSELILGILDVQRLARFATSDKTNEISKLGFMLPAKEIRVVDE